MKLMDCGENRAVRCFLMLYGQSGVTVATMQNHLISCGFAHWPEWVDADDAQGHLTKGGAQDWLRHLFALESANAEITVRSNNEYQSDIDNNSSERGYGLLERLKLHTMDDLLAQNQQVREALVATQQVLSANGDNFGRLAQLKAIAALALPDTATSTLAKRDAETLRNAAGKLEYGVRKTMADQLCEMADALEVGK